MYAINQLIQEIREITDTLIQRKESVHPDWITQEIINNHQDVAGNDSDFYLCVGRETIRVQVRKQINRFKLTPEQALAVDKQIVLPGFERLQRAYIIEIGNEQIAIPLERMTSEQRQAKVDELRAMGEGCYQHADELERYDDEHPPIKEAA